MAHILVNLGGSLTLFEAARLFGIRRVVHMSSEETYRPRFDIRAGLAAYVEAVRAQH